MPEESINIYMSLVDKVSGPLSGIFRGVRAYSTGYVPNPQRDRWKREDRRTGELRRHGDEKSRPEGRRGFVVIVLWCQGRRKPRTQ